VTAILARLVLAFSLAIAVPVAAKGRAKIYSVIFEFSYDAEGQLTQWEVTKVIDPASGRQTALKIEVPKTYIDAARVKQQAGLTKGKAGHAFTYYYFDPRFPDNPDIPFIP
jgi:hypothetical protein